MSRSKSPTIKQVLDGHADALVERPGVGRRLEREAELLVARAPVVERGHHLVVLEILADGALEHDLKSINTIKNRILLAMRFIHRATGGQRGHRSRPLSAVPLRKWAGRQRRTPPSGREMNERKHMKDNSRSDPRFVCPK